MIKLKTIVLATGNPGKVREIRTLLKTLSGIKIKKASQFKRIPPVKENGNSYFENALKKALTFARKTGLPALAEDSGLEIPGLGGAPGILSSRFAGKRASDEENIKKVLREMSGMKSNRNATFSCTAVLYMPDGKYFVAEGHCPGQIAESPHGKNGFGYDPIFIPKGFKRTFAELSIKTKNRISHRSLAMKKLWKVIAMARQRIEYLH